MELIGLMLAIIYAAIGIVEYFRRNYAEAAFFMSFASLIMMTAIATKLV